MAFEQRMKRWKHDFILVAYLLLTTTWLTRCAIPITHHDITTYKNLTDLKAEAMMLVETFDTLSFADNEAARADITLQFRKACNTRRAKENRTAIPCGSLMRSEDC
jgi:hypothetical protein